MTGLVEIRPFYAELFADLFKPGTYDFTMNTVAVTGDMAYIHWKATTRNLDIPMATDTFLVKDGKIRYQSFAGHMVPKS